MKNYAKYINSNKVSHEDYSQERTIATPYNRIPTLAQIVAQLESGRPMDTTLDRHLGYNVAEREPCFRKGYDLVDAWHDLHSIKASIDEANDAIENAMINARPVKDEVTPTPPPEPVPVPTSE